MTCEPYSYQKFVDATASAWTASVEATALRNRCQRLLVAAGAPLSPVDYEEISSARKAGEAALAALCSSLDKLRSAEARHRASHPSQW